MVDSGNGEVEEEKEKKMEMEIKVAIQRRDSSMMSYEDASELLEIFSVRATRY